MPLVPSGHDRRGWLKLADAEREPSDVGTVQTRPSAANKAEHSFHSGVPRLDRLLMTALLLAVAGWIGFRVVLLLLTLD